jgi:hypothetical protein
MRNMRFLFLLFSLLAGAPVQAQEAAADPPLAPAGTSAPAVAAEADSSCLPASIQVDPRHRDAPLRLGQWLTLRLSGHCKQLAETLLLQTDVAAGTADKDDGIVLLLNKVPMEMLPLLAAQSNDRNQLLLSFRLLRNGNDDSEDNHETWNTFLRNNQTCCDHLLDQGEMDVAIALALGSTAAIALGEEQNVQFRVANRGLVAATFWVLLLAFIVLYGLAIRSPGLLRDAPGGTHSLAKAQMAFWGLIVALSFSGIWFVTGTTEHIPDGVLILLGISASTGWLSTVAGNSRDASAVASIASDRNQLQASSDASVAASPEHQIRLQGMDSKIQRILKGDHLREAENFLRDICSDGDGMSVHRTQAAAWTLILGVVFVCEVTSVISMPVFATNLLLLLGISNGTYLGLKTREAP